MADLQSVVQLPPFSKGMITNQGASAPADSALSLIDWNLTADGMPMLRDGLTPPDSPQVNDVYYTAAFPFVGDFTTPIFLTHGWVLVAEDGTMDWDLGAAGTGTQASAFNPKSSVNEWSYHLASGVMDNFVYLTKKESGAQHKINLTSATRSGLASHQLDGATTGFPSAVTVAVHQSRMWAANIRLTAQDHYSRVAWSNPGAPETWDAADFIDIDPDDQDAITCIKPFGEDLVVFKHYKMYLITGRSEASFSVYPISDYYGTPSQATVVDMGDMLIFLTNNSEVVAFDGSGFAVLNDNYRGHNTATDNDDAGVWVDEESYTASAFRLGPLYLLSTNAYSGAPARVTHIYDTRFGAWSRWSYGFLTGHWFGNLGFAGGYIWGQAREDATYADAGRQGVFVPALNGDGQGQYQTGTPADMNITLRTPNYAFSQAGEKFRLRRLYTVWSFQALSTGTGPTIQVSMHVDGKETPVATQSFTLTRYATGQKVMVEHVVTSGFSEEQWRTVGFTYTVTSSFVNVERLKLERQVVTVSGSRNVRGEELV